MGLKLTTKYYNLWSNMDIQHDYKNYCLFYYSIISGTYFKIDCFLIYP